MLDSNDLNNSIKKAAVEAVIASKPTGIMFGKVTSASPLKINVEQKMTLTDAQLILPRNLTTHQVYMTVEHSTESDGYMEGSHTHIGANGVTDSGNLDITHKHEYKGKKLFTVHNGLVVGDKVILVQMQGGQKFIVLDRVVTA